LHTKSEAESSKHEPAGNYEPTAFRERALKTTQQSVDMWRAEMNWIMQLREEPFLQKDEVPQLMIFDF
jgi:hypothetical protein